MVLAILSVCQGCAQKIDYPTPHNYNLNEPEKYFLPESLTEISGISFHEGKADSMYAVQDELGRLFYFKPGVKSVTYATFGKTGDYEGVSITKDRVIVLMSNGTLVSFPFSERRDKQVASARIWKDLIPKAEYESLYADPATGLIYVICKSCKQDAKKDQVTGYTLQLTASDSIIPVGSFTISTAGINLENAKNKRKNLRPSAVSKHPITGDWYLIAAINKQLVVLDSNWKVTASYALNPSLFKQPEGLTFDKNGNLYISNEGDELAVATLLKFDYLEGGNEAE